MAGTLRQHPITGATILVPKLTTESLRRAMDDYGPNGRLGTVGYSTRDDISRAESFKEKGDRIVIREANRLDWTYPELVAWVDSKYGRWFWDCLHGSNDAASAKAQVTLDWIDRSDLAHYFGEEF